MRSSIFSLIVFSLLITGCSPATEQQSPSVLSDVPVGAASLSFNKVIFPGGKEVVFDGRIIRYEFIKNPKASIERFTIFSREGLMSLDGAAFAELAKLGYTRRIRREEAGLFVVNYQKKGSVTITAVYSEHSTEFPADNIRSKAVFTWQVRE